MSYCSGMIERGRRMLLYGKGSPFVAIAGVGFGAGGASVVATLLHAVAPPGRAKEAMRAMEMTRTAMSVAMTMARPWLQTICLHLCEPEGSYTERLFVRPSETDNKMSYLLARNILMSVNS